MFASDLTLVTLDSSLLSVSDIVINGDPSLADNIIVLKSRLEHQNATSGVTTFRGTLSTTTFLGLTTVNVGSITSPTVSPKNNLFLSFTGALVVTGTLTTTYMALLMPNNLTTSYVPITALTALAISGNIAINMGRDKTVSNNSMQIQWDASNLNTNLQLTNTSTGAIKINSTQSNFLGTVVDNNTNPYKPSVGLGYSSFTGVAGPNTSNTKSLSTYNTNPREFFVYFANVTHSAGITVPITLQVGQSSTYMSATAGVYEGNTNGDAAVTKLWTTAGIDVWDTSIVLNSGMDTTIKFSYMETVSGSGQLWTVSIWGGSSGTDNQYLYGSGRIQMPLATPTITSVRMNVPTGNTVSGAWVVVTG